MPDVRAIALIALCLLACACRNDMHDQPRYGPYRRSELWADGRSARPLLEGTIARGQLRHDPVYFQGRTEAAAAAPPSADPVPIAAQQGVGAEDAFTFAPGLVREFPAPVTAETVQRGRSRYEVFCTPCHGYTGAGNGMIVQRGLSAPPSFHIDRLREAPAGHFFDVITNGYGAMYSYAARIPVGDRWAIIAYLRALQLSQTATPDDVPAGSRSALGDPPAPPSPPQPGEMRPQDTPPASQRPLEGRPPGAR